MLAIVIPYYKRTFFEETLQSLAAQTDKRFHVYIGDDASPEPCVDLLEKYKGTFAFTFKRFESNLGGISLVKQWERCIDMVQEEEWLMILGDDDVLGTNVVEEFYKLMESNNSDELKVIKYSTQKIDEKGNNISKIYKQDAVQNAVSFALDKLEGKTRGSLSENIFKTSEIKKKGIPYFPLAWYADDWMVLKLSSFKNIYCINEAVVSIRISDRSISGGDYKELKSKAERMYFKNLINKSDIFTVEQKYRFTKILFRRYVNHKKSATKMIDLIMFYFKRMIK